MFHVPLPSAYWTYAILYSFSQIFLQRIINKIKIDKDLEEEVIEQQVLMENTSIDPIAIVAVSQALSK